ncbi:flagellar protein FliS [Aneurinibacillus soli]|uniref:Flagellar protein FliS n=1 Tax=Aneurinibacillus soli TaxID=1500254 RepID=A0A0U5B8N9_9BACL|nr:flagellar export chaperone FliS [Aneurinibacillus soli]PYE61478.1 flagellar protein FliS [Aneurinibacillus soli]BAU26567.1 Flagellar protein FliS [Aneurinibacillus soli]
MAYTASAAQQYRQNSVLTTTPADLTLRLYQGLVKFLRTALTGIEQGKLEDVNTNLIKSQDILRELLCTLNMGVPIAKDMAAMYEYMLERSMEANMKKDKEIIKEILGFAEDFYDTWMKVTKAVKV